MENSLTSSEGRPQLVRMFEEAESATETPRKLAERDRDYRDGRQWTSDEETALTRRGQPVVTFNRIGRKVDYLLGLERQMRRDPKAFPRNPDDEQAAQAGTDSLRYVCDDEDWDAKRSESMENIVVEGTGAIMVGAKQTKNGIDPRLIHIPWERLFYDPHSRRLDFSDAQYMGIVTWMDFDDAVAKYPDAKEILEQTKAMAASHSVTYDDRPLSHRWVDTKRNRLRVIEGYYRKAGQWMFCIATEGGELVATQPSPYLDEDGKPECPIKAVSYYIDRDNNRYGGVRAMIGPQDEVNKRRSKGLHLITMRQARVSRAAAVDGDKLKSELAKPDGLIVADKDEFEVLTTNDMAAANFNLLQEAKAEIDLLGPNAALQGKNEQDMSGRAILAQQQGGMVEVAMLFDRLRVLSLAVYRSVWARIKQYWNEERWIRVTDDERNLRFVGINKPVSMLDVAKERLQDDPDAELKLAMLAREPMAQQPIRIDNAVAELDVDIVIDEGIDTPSIQAEQFDIIAKVLPTAVNLPPPYLKLLIKASALRDKDDLLQEIEKMAQGPQIPPELQQQIEQGMQLIQQQGAEIEQLKQAMANKEADIAVKGAKVMADTATANRQMDIEAYQAETDRIGVLKPEPRPQ